MSALDLSSRNPMLVLAVNACFPENGAEMLKGNLKPETLEAEVEWLTATVRTGLEVFTTPPSGYIQAIRLLLFLTTEEVVQDLLALMAEVWGLRLVDWETSIRSLSFHHLLSTTGSLTVEFEDGEPVKGFDPSTRETEEGSTWGEIYHTVYRVQPDGSWIGRREQTGQYVCG